MEIKSIVNNDIVNLQNCEQEPIHIPGSIQPHGFLLGLKQDTLTIDYCSANTAEYLALLYGELLGKNFADVFGHDAVNALKQYVSQGSMLSSSLLRLTLNGVDFVCTLHDSNGIYVLEAEPVSDADRAASQVYDQTSQFLTYMHDTHTLKELCALVAKGTREITGYDRVMVYRFDKDYNGEVFAESVRDDLEPFLGLHYPHTDIPPQARQLYMTNLLRLITDIEYTPVPIYTIDDAPGKNLDLSLSILRSTSPIHVQYLHNMGVGATLTISLIHQRRLWGLIACHHYTPKNLTPEIRLAAQLQGHFITSQIELRQRNEEYETLRKATASLDAMNAASQQSRDISELVMMPELTMLCNASGVSVLFDGNVYKSGLAPEDEDIKQLASWLAVYTSNGTFHTDKLVDHLLGNEKVCDTVSGIVYHSLDAENNSCIIWYRPETQTEVHWGGDPQKAIIKDEKGLSPRNSFELWKEIVNCQSKPWLQPELDTAAAYANSLQRQISLMLISREEEKYRKLSEILKETNAELENINWISTHDLQEPLRKIQLISSRILIKEPELSESVQDSLNRVNASANRMQTLLVDILKYTKLKQSDEAFIGVNLNEVLEEVSGELAESADRPHVIIDALPTVQGVPFLIKQLFSNLVTNSLKYSSPGRQTEIKITSDHQPLPYRNDDSTLYHIIHVADNGIGFEQQYAESIFNIFTKLHASSDYKGSGVGLALCKKIMQTHQGYITASGQPGIGAVFSLYFPVKS